MGFMILDFRFMIDRTIKDFGLVFYQFCGF